MKGLRKGSNNMKPVNSTNTDCRGCKIHESGGRCILKNNVHACPCHRCLVKVSCSQNCDKARTLAMDELHNELKRNPWI